MGKTRLALEAPARSVSDFPDGVSWVELAVVTDPGMVESTLVQALEVRPLPGLSELDAAVGLLSALGGLSAFGADR